MGMEYKLSSIAVRSGRLSLLDLLFFWIIECNDGIGISR